MKSRNGLFRGASLPLRAVLPALCLAAQVIAALSPAPRALAEDHGVAPRQATYRGWKAYVVENGLVRLHVVPEIGGRIIQYALGEKEFFWVNPALAGNLPPESGLDPKGGWLNYGGDKLWPAPQGWDNDQQWPGPPDAVLDGQPYRVGIEREPGGIRLTSRDDPRSGIRFARRVRLDPHSTRVSVEATMTSVGDKPRRWGIWAHTQLNGAKTDGPGHNPLLQAWCPLNPESRFPKGYSVIFGAADNPSFQPDARRGLMRVQYQYQVGKVGLDSHAGWVATVDGQSGAVFVQRFVFEPKREYPDGSSVEFWLNGTGRIRAYNREIVMSADAAENPCVFESELLSPFARLEPGQSYTWRYGWCAANIGGDFPVLDCSDAGVTAERLSAGLADGRARLKGRFGVFAPGSVRAEIADAQGGRLQTLDLPLKVSPLAPVVLDAAVAVPANAASIRLALAGPDGQAAGELGRVDLRQGDGAARWPAERAWAWHKSQPWRVGCNFLPSSAVNDVEMWQMETFDPPTIDRELGWAGQLGFNTVRVFVNYAVWEADASGLKETLRRFLAIADKHGIATLVVLFDDCFKPEPRVGRQEAPEPGVHNSQWVQSPGAKRRGDRAAWPKLRQYVTDVVGEFASDQRVLAWELYNEPSQSLPLVESAFRWAREAAPSQPITTTIFGDAEMRKRIIELSDVLCFHNYGPLPGVKAEVAGLLAHGRPVLCTEWMARGGGSRFETHLPFFKQRKIGCWSWGLVAGRTQTYFPWGSPKNAPEPALWHHDILRKDGTPYRPREVRFIQVTTGKLPASALPRTTVLVPTAEKRPVACRYTTAKPADGWFRPEFDDAAWRQGEAPFGKEEPAIGRRPNTAWSTADLWVRREFEMPAGKFTDLALALHHDEDTEVYLNGVLAVRAGGYNAAYESFDIAPEAQAALKPGRRNLLAVHCRQTAGGQYLDLGIEGVAAESK